MNYKSILYFTLFISTLISAQQNSLSQNNRYGIFVREVVIRVDPPDVMKWEEAVKKIVAAALKSKPTELDWLLYKSQPYEYWVILFGDKIENIPGDEQINETFLGTTGEPEYKEALSLLSQTNFEIIRDIICQQDLIWSTVKSMSTETNPKARVIDYWMKPGAEVEFDKLQQQYVNFLKSIDYPYPVESFGPRIGAPRVFQVVTFPDNWSNFYGTNDLYEWAAKMHRGKELNEINNHRSKIILRSTYYDLDFIKELSSP